MFNKNNLNKKKLSLIKNLLAKKTLSFIKKHAIIYKKNTKNRQNFDFFRKFYLFFIIFVVLYFFQSIFILIFFQLKQGCWARQCNINSKSFSFDQPLFLKK